MTVTDHTSSREVYRNLNPLREEHKRQMDFLDLFEQALDGDVGALAICLDRSAKLPEGEQLSSKLTLIPLHSPLDAERMKGRLMEAVAEGVLDARHAGKPTAMLEKMRLLLKDRKKSPHVLAEMDLQSPLFMPSEDGTSPLWRDDLGNDRHPRDPLWMEELGDCNRNKRLLDARIDQILKGDGNALRSFTVRDPSRRELFLASTRLEMLALKRGVDVDCLKGKVTRAMAEGAISREEGVRIYTFLEQVRGGLEKRKIHG
ncbi:MAG: hypothetical protein HQL53_01990 [Magnetococcales bacterium]|nr:hypothetical protein [Magnetococcales bacterium]